MTLEDEIIERQLKQKYFSINEIKKIIQSSVAALSHLSKSKGNYHIGL
jgi:DNA-binding transcriptional MerR regulator